MICKNRAINQTRLLGPKKKTKNYFTFMRGKNLVGNKLQKKLLEETKKCAIVDTEDCKAGLKINGLRKIIKNYWNLLKRKGKTGNKLQIISKVI